MKTELNLLPPEYSQPSPSPLASLAAWAVPCLLTGAAAAFFCLNALDVSGNLLSRKRESERIKAETFARLERAAARTDLLEREALLRRRLARAAGEEVPLAELLKGAQAVFSTSGEVRSLSADAGTCLIEVLLDSGSDISAGLRMMKHLPYGPYRLLSRRDDGQGRVRLRLEGRRKKL